MYFKEGREIWKACFLSSESNVRMNLMRKHNGSTGQNSHTQLLSVWWIPSPEFDPRNVHIYSTVFLILKQLWFTVWRVGELRSLSTLAILKEEKKTFFFIFLVKIQQAEYLSRTFSLISNLILPPDTFYFCKQLTLSLRIKCITHRAVITFDT